MLKESEAMLNSCKINMKKDLEDSLSSLNASVASTRQEFLGNAPFAAPSPSQVCSLFSVSFCASIFRFAHGTCTCAQTVQGDPDVDAAFKLINDFKRKVGECRSRATSLAAGLEIFNIDQPSYTDLDDTTREIGLFVSHCTCFFDSRLLLPNLPKILMWILMICNFTEALEGIWQATQQWMAFWQDCKVCKFMELKSEDMDREAQKFQKNLVKLGKVRRRSCIFFIV